MAQNSRGIFESQKIKVLFVYIFAAKDLPEEVIHYGRVIHLGQSVHTRVHIALHPPSLDLLQVPLPLGKNLSDYIALLKGFSYQL
jgi:hypothetical protein